MITIPEMIAENDRRINELYAEYDPEIGLGSPIKRFPLRLDNTKTIFLPISMKDTLWVQLVEGYETVAMYFSDLIRQGKKERWYDGAYYLKNLEEDRYNHDFEFWAFRNIKIEDKKTYRIIPFKLRRAQRKLLMSFEKQRLANIPIRTIVAKARQWGGSTLTEIYMMWIQQRHKTNWHLAVIAHLDDAAKHIRGMYSRAAKYYPSKLGSITLSPYERSAKNMICKERGCIMGVGSVENPDQFHSYSYAMCHLSEVGRWSETTKKSAQELMQAIRPTVPDVPYSMIVLESTANGRGNLFHNEWQAAVKGTSRYDPVFVAWWEIEIYQRPISDHQKFIDLIKNHPNHEYLMSLWERGATLEGINWYLFTKSAENLSDLQMWRQFPSDAEESFSSTGRRVFSPLYITKASRNCSPPLFRGQLFAQGQKFKEAFEQLDFNETPNGDLWIWAPPDKSEPVKNRYVVILDIGGKSDTADYSTAIVLDRYWLMDGGCPVTVAVLKCHMDQDLFAWAGAQLAYWYNKALLVVESNSLRKEQLSSEGDHFLTVLDEIVDYYPNIYARTDPAKIRQGAPIMYGFHTNSATKPMVINALNAAMRDDQIIITDKRIVDEADQYEFKQDGTMGGVDGTHDDLLVPTAIGVWISESAMDVPIIIESKPKPPKRRRTEAML